MDTDFGWFCYRVDGLHRRVFTVGAMGIFTFLSVGKLYKNAAL